MADYFCKYVRYHGTSVTWYDRFFQKNRKKFGRTQRMYEASSNFFFEIYFPLGTSSTLDCCRARRQHTRDAITLSAPAKTSSGWMSFRLRVDGSSECRCHKSPFRRYGCIVARRDQTVKSFFFRNLSSILLQITVLYATTGKERGNVWIKGWVTFSSWILYVYLFFFQHVIQEWNWFIVNTGERSNHRLQTPMFQKEGQSWDLRAMYKRIDIFTT